MNTLNPLAAKTNPFLHNQQFIPSTPVLPKPHLTFLSFKTPSPLSINASSCPKTPNSKPPFKSLTPLRFLKPTLITSITATAIFFTGFNFNPKLAISAPVSPPPPTVGVSEDTQNALEEEKQAVSVPVTPPVAEDAAAVDVAVSVENTQNALEEDKQEVFAPVTPPPSADTAAVDVAVSEEEVPSNPNDVDILRNLLGKHITDKKLVDAIRVVDRLIELQPGKTEWHFMKSHVYIHNGELELAKQSFRDIILKDPFYIEAYRGLVIVAFEDESIDIEEMEKIGKMVEDGIEMCVKENKGSQIRDFKLLLAQIWVIESKYDDALKVYHELAEEEPMDFRPYFCQSIIYTKLNKKDEAEKYLEKYRELVPREDPKRKFEFVMT